LRGGLLTRSLPLKSSNHSLLCFLKRRQPALQPGLQAGEALLGAVVIDGHGERAAGADQHDEFFAAADGGVEQVALQHHVVAGGDRDDDGRVFGALGLVDGDGVGQGKVV